MTIINNINNIKIVILSLLIVIFTVVYIASNKEHTLSEKTIIITWVNEISGCSRALYHFKGFQFWKMSVKTKVQVLSRTHANYLFYDREVNVNHLHNFCWPHIETSYNTHRHTLILGFCSCYPYLPFAFCLWRSSQLPPIQTGCHPVSVSWTHWVLNCTRQLSYSLARNTAKN